MQNEKICTVCNLPFYKPLKLSRTQWEEKQTCSPECRAVARAAKTKECVVCGAEFRPQGRADRSTCSRPCKAKLMRIETDDKVCENCGVTFSRPNQLGLDLWARRKLCSFACRTAWAKQNKIGFQKAHPVYSEEGRYGKGQNAWIDGKSGIRPGKGNPQSLRDYFANGGKSWNKGKKGVYSEETLKKMRESRALVTIVFPSGEKHWNWKGGTTKLRYQLQQTYLYKGWRKQVFERDDYTCQICGQRGGSLAADHIVPYAKIIADNNITTVEEAKLCKVLWDILNGRTLCMSCHQKTDTYGSKSIQSQKNS